LNLHLLTPRILKRATIRRNEESGYPNRLKKRVAKTIVTKKGISCFTDAGIPAGDPSFFSASFFIRKIRSRKRPDKSISKIPRQSGKNPVSAVRRVPMGILKERRAVANPKRKRTIPPANSFLSK
jgi:hypothetical protein